MIKILTHKAQSFGTQIEQHAISHLIILLNHNMALCVNELEKLSILGRVVSEKDIDYLVHSNAPLSVDSMIVELLCKRAFLEMLNKLLELGNDSADILKSLERSISEILQFQAYIKTNGGINAIEILGYNPPKHILDTKSRLANTIKPQTLLKIFETIIELGDELRSAKNPQKEALLYAIMLKIQALL